MISNKRHLVKAADSDRIFTKCFEFKACGDVFPVVPQKILQELGNTVAVGNSIVLTIDPRADPAFKSGESGQAPMR